MSDSLNVTNPPQESKPPEDAVWHLKAVQESQGDAMISVDLEGAILSWNSAAEQLFGYVAENTIGKSIEDFFVAAEVPPILDRIRQGDSIPDHETTIITVEGSEVAVSLEYSPMLNPFGSLIGATLSVRNLTELEATRQALTRLAKVFVDAGDPIIIEDVFGRIVELNPQAEFTYGYTRDKLLGQPMKILVPEDHHRQADELLNRCLQGGHVRNVESVRQNSDGEIFPVLLTLSLVTNEYGKPTQVVTLCKDIREKRIVEPEVINELERLNEDLEDFVSAAGHDLRATLVAISLLSKVARREVRQEGDNERIARSVQRIEDGAARAIAMLESLRRYARAGGKAMQPTAVDLDEVLNDVLKDLKHEIDANQVRLDVGTLPQVFGDRMRLMQLFQNLIRNAVKFRSDDPPRIAITADREDEMWRISLKDNGIGIAQEDHELIFSAFRRLHSEGEYEGTGVGLAICRKIVEQHKGRIWVDSEPGQGATFRFTLPSIGLTE